MRLKKNVKSEEIKYSVIRQVRLSEEYNRKIKIRAKELGCHDVDVIRKAIIEYFDRAKADEEIVYSALTQNSNRIQSLENNVELLGLFIMQEMRTMFEYFPDKKFSIDVESKMADFTESITSEFKNHPRVLRSILLNAIEQEVEDDDMNEEF